MSASKTVSANLVASAAERGNCLTAKAFFGVLLGYFALQIVLRVLISSSVDLDESDQFVLTQKLSSGYGSQPPLYTWLQFFFFQIFGISVFSAALLKNLLLFCTYLFTYLNARLITRNHLCGVAAAASLVFIPQIVWESQRDLTHSVLASALMGATVFSFLRLHDKRCLSGYMLFGICAGLGLISKYNYVLLLAGLFVAAISLRELRPIIFDRRILLTLAIMLLIVAPNAIWMVNHRELALQSAHKFHLAEHPFWSSAVWSGLKSLLISTVTFICPLALVYGLIFWKHLSAAAQPRSVPVKLLLRTLVIIYAVMIFSVLVFGVTDIRERWLQPMLICAPVLAIALMETRLNLARLRWLLSLAAIGMLVVSVMIPGRIIFAEKYQRTQPLNKPYDVMARALQPALMQTSVIVADGHLLAGNLRLNLPEKTFMTPRSASLLGDKGRPRALVWEATPSPKRKRQQSLDMLPLPENLRALAAQTGVTNLDEMQIQYFSATFKFHRSRQMKVGLLLLP
jgi:4-amino-4-deoxy-L-arabinose transferase-like glycosyltransferase